MECHHKLKEKCHLTYVTDYHPTPEEKCETIFKKSCHITFKPVPHTEKVKKCHTPYEKKCGPGIKGKEICKFVYDNNCETKYEEYDVEEDTPVCEIKEVEKCEEKNFQLFHLPLKEGQKPFAKKQLCEKWPVKKCEVQHNNVKKVHPKTECKKESRKVCYPDNCELVPGKEICYEEEVVQIQNIPEEECDLDPHKDCKTVTSLVPRLVPKKNCVKVPKEICVNTKKNPKQVPKKVVKNWCYDPEELRNLD
ncbi:Uncharacterized protein FKW44_012097 [Caligus rogercresseyi]|uniref:Uncharacterized protein n=2 Tax=Caligus rogercresseyi TaxID=217165 RepID=A0A7T8HIW4_CALRO|nr:Uncharacterized protein FKW44_012097 [Caligus rogercresseyi]